MVHAVVIVLGDIGRSPRMQYHANSLSQLPYVSKVTLVGYGGEKVIADLQNNGKVDVCALELAKLRSLEVKSSILRALLKGTYLIMWLLYVLALGIQRYEIVLIQNPPALPAFFVAWFVSFFNGAKIILDWHNLGFSIYEHGLKSKTHPLVQITKFCEQRLCKYAARHICVSNALKEYLHQHCDINATVVYDRPPNVFQVAQNANTDQVSSRIEFLESLGVQDIPIRIKASSNPALIVSGTSWTADEDFSILLQALVNIEQHLSKATAQELSIHDSLICVVTGKGDLRSYYEKYIGQLYAEKKLGRFVSVHTAWLSNESYPRLLASADLGISLHASTSGLDLPMKVLDMFGSGLPVVALSFPTLPELVENDVNGLIFSSTEELQAHLLFGLFSNPGANRLEQFRRTLLAFERWDTNWTKHMEPVVQSLSR
jgi:beta-1,4-mannosyltransferase